MTRTLAIGQAACGKSNPTAVAGNAASAGSAIVGPDGKLTFGRAAQ